MADDLNRVPLPYGKRSKYTPLSRELFWDIEENNLYLYNDDHWILIGGNGKQRFTEAGDNIEIVYRDDDPEHFYPILRLKDDIDIDTMELGKFSNTLRWKGMIKLGEVHDTSFFPLVRFNPSLEEIIGGKFLVKVFRGDVIEYGIYQATASSCGWGSIFGSDDQNVKFTVNREVFSNAGGAWVGFRTFNDLRNGTSSKYLPPDKIEVWFNGWDNRANKEVPDGLGDNFSASKVIARN